ncbi:fused MFS/spermidine synthase [Paenibacillus sp. V4I7]|uniref:fused MFS/spermidine synthase n=1 Tax=Paenibacillus sp. V4I7 TaxID=3042307 RepID=UPI00277E5565|nr:fused MFS/spermidine synthase [Paenibacillus sp. V4I7]MDQ0897349.1 spermidine synthase [Paenibacillus sp. V4I7]
MQKIAKTTSKIKKLIPKKTTSIQMRGDIWDQYTLKHLLQRKPKIIYKGKSRFQNIILLEAKDVRLYLDKQLQFSSLDERFYHEALVHPAMTMSPNRRNVLILGGGDGFAVREVLKYKDVKTVDLVELDPQIIKVAKRKPISTLNHRSLFDKRVKVHQMDAKLFFPTSKSYQVIIVDFPDPSDKMISKLYTKEFFKRVVKSLAPDGMIVIQSNSTEDMPRVYWSIHHTLKSIGMNTKSYFVYVPSFGDWGFQIASFKNFIPGRKKVSVPNQTLPKNLSTLFKLPEEVLESRNTALPNSLKNLRLYKYYHLDQKSAVAR